MPKITLKPNSAEYADSKTKKPQIQVCEMPGCPFEAGHKAPKHRGLNDYYHFCLDHVRDYNKAWNFFTGMSDHEVEDHMIDSIYGFRPTYKYDPHSNMHEDLKRRAWQTYNFTDKEPPNGSGGGAHGGAHRGRSGFGMDKNTPEFEALSIMGLEPPITLEAIKTKYKKLAKMHHPDLNKNDPASEELLKKINMSYTILKLAFAQYEELEKRNS